MELILANANGIDERVIDHEYDIELGGENTFQITVPYSEWAGDLSFRKRIYVAGTEYGGIINDIKGDTSKDSIFVSGYTWRGILNKRYAEPFSFSGDLNNLIALLVPADGTFATTSVRTGVNVGVTITEYTKIEQVISEACAKVGFRFDLSYQNDHVVLSAVPAMNINGEVTQDSPLDFESEDNRMGINHLICIGKSAVVHLYADASGNVSQSQTFRGIDEYTGVHTSTTEDREKLIEEGTAELKKEANYKSLTAYLSTMEDMNIGDFVTGRDYVTGITMTQPIVKKIITYKDGDLSIQNKIEGEQ